jgi:hypothetical protein
VNAHEAAHKVLREAGRPLPSKEVARRVLSKGYHSNAQSPVDSIAQTLEKNIRDKVYNRPELQFVQTTSGRMISLPDRLNAKSGTGNGKPGSADPRLENGMQGATDHQTSMIALPSRLLSKIDLCVQVGLGPSREIVAAQMLLRGLEAASEEIGVAVRDHIRAPARANSGGN